MEIKWICVYRMLRNSSLIPCPALPWLGRWDGAWFNIIVIIIITTVLVVLVVRFVFRFPFPFFLPYPLLFSFNVSLKFFFSIFFLPLFLLFFSYLISTLSSLFGCPPTCWGDENTIKFMGKLVRISGKWIPQNSFSVTCKLINFDCIRYLIKKCLVDAAWVNNAISLTNYLFKNIFNIKICFLKMFKCFPIILYY